MLDRDHLTPPAGETLEDLACRVELPPVWEDFFEKTGALPSGADDKRRHPRHYLRTYAAVGYHQTFSSVPRRQAWHKVYTKDVSRSGLAFLHSEQLFPRERLEILLPDGRTCFIEVARCHRIQDRCFEVGARFVDKLHESIVPNGPPESTAGPDRPQKP